MCVFLTYFCFYKSFKSFCMILWIMSSGMFIRVYIYLYLYFKLYSVSLDVETAWNLSLYLHLKEKIYSTLIRSVFECCCDVKSTKARKTRILCVVCTAIYLPVKRFSFLPQLSEFVNFICKHYLQFL